MRAQFLYNKKTLVFVEGRELSLCVDVEHDVFRNKIFDALNPRCVRMGR